MFTSLRLTLAILTVFFTPLAFAQHGGGPPSNGGGGGGRTGSTTPTTGMPPGTGNLPGNSLPAPQLERQPIFISGSVVIGEGSAPSEPVAIERVCNGRAHKEGYTDSKGHYSIQLGQNFEQQDVSESSDISTRGIFGSSSTARFGMPSSGVDPRELLNCELRAVLPGFTSSNVMIHPDGSFGQLKVDTIVLQRVGRSEGTTISMTTMEAPSGARKAYEKAENALAHKKIADAEKQLNKAVNTFPRFAAAWSLLGMIHLQGKQYDQATKEFEQSIAADPQYVNPYAGLANIAARQSQWKDTIRFSDQAERLNPLAFPEVYFFSSLAYFNLGNVDSAEQKVRKFISIDTGHRKPVAMLLLSDILVRKRDFAGAVQQTEQYLAMAPDAPNAPDIRNKLKRLQQLSATAGKP
jgi:tetratricopeptide (TPR) repeat protein